MSCGCFFVRTALMSTFDRVTALRDEVKLTRSRKQELFRYLQDSQLLTLASTSETKAAELPEFASLPGVPNVSERYEPSPTRALRADSMRSAASTAAATESRQLTFADVERLYLDSSAGPATIHYARALHAKGRRFSDIAELSLAVRQEHDIAVHRRYVFCHLRDLIERFWTESVIGRSCSPS